MINIADKTVDCKTGLNIQLDIYIKHTEIQ